MDTAESDFNIFCSAISLDKDPLHMNDKVKYIEQPNKKNITETENSVPVR